MNRRSRSLWQWLHNEFHARHQQVIAWHQAVRMPPRRICRKHVLLALIAILLLILLLTSLAHPALARDAWRRSAGAEPPARLTAPTQAAVPLRISPAHHDTHSFGPPPALAARAILPQASAPDLAAPPPPLPPADPPRVYREPVAEMHLLSHHPAITATAILTATALPTSLEPLPVRVVLASAAGDAGEGHDVRGEPSLTGGQVDTILARYGSPALGTGPVWEDLSRQYGIDNAYALSFFITESTVATDPHWSGRKPGGSTTHNIGNIVCASYPRCYGRWRDYATWEEGIADWYRLIAEEYINARGTVTVEQIVPIYAPAFENDVPRYIAGVVRRVAAWHVIPPDQWLPMPPPQTRLAIAYTTETPTPADTEPPQPGAVRMPDLVGMDIEYAYRVLAKQGIPVGVVDIQGRDHIPDLFDQVAPNTVVSSMPGVDEWVLPGEAVVLGVRAPDAAPGQPEPAAPEPADVPTPVPDDIPAVPRTRIGQPVPAVPTDTPESGSVSPADPSSGAPGDP